MKNKMKNIILVLSISILATLFLTNLAQANGLSLDVIKKCNFQYGGDDCIAEFDITNSTGGILDGTAFFDVDYNGVCGNSFEVGGIDIWYNNQVPKMEWDNESKKFVSLGFEIPNGLSKANLKIHTSSGLCPGKYTFGLQIKGVPKEEEDEDEEEEIITPLSAIGGGGRYIAPETSEVEEEIEEGEVAEETIEGEEISEEEIEEGIGGEVIPEGVREEEGVGEVVEEGETPEGEEEIIILPEEEEESRPSLLAAIGNIITFGTGNVWVAIIVAIIVLTFLTWFVYYFAKKVRKRKFKKE